MAKQRSSSHDHKSEKQRPTTFGWNNYEGSIPLTRSSDYQAFSVEWIAPLRSQYMGQGPGFDGIHSLDKADVSCFIVRG
jgi:hypothetical protein